MPPAHQPYRELAELADFVVDRDFVTIWEGSFWGSRLHQALIEQRGYRDKTLNGR
jgi:hypothetical protein